MSGLGFREMPSQVLRLTIEGLGPGVGPYFPAFGSGLPHNSLKTRNGTLIAFRLLPGLGVQRGTSRGREKVAVSSDALTLPTTLDKAPSGLPSHCCLLLEFIRAVVFVYLQVGLRCH